MWGLGKVEDHTLSAYDFQVYSAGNESVSRIGYRVNITAATFNTGEPLQDDGSGLAEICADDPPAVLGIALEPAVSTSNRMNAMEVTATGDTRRLIDIPTPEKRYVARYFSVDGLTPAVPTVLNAVGNTAGFSLIGVHWYVDTLAANTHVRIEDVIDAGGFSLLDDSPTPGVGDRVIFRFI